MRLAQLAVVAQPAPVGTAERLDKAVLARARAQEALPELPVREEA